MLYIDPPQQEAFKAALERARNIWEDPIVTEVEQLEQFYVAEDEHQDFFNKNPESGYCSIVIVPKVLKARSAYAKWFKEN
jgi:peptide-methionine (S)-S-oxide reductase